MEVATAVWTTSTQKLQESLKTILASYILFKNLFFSTFKSPFPFQFVINDRQVSEVSKTESSINITLISLIKNTQIKYKLK